MLEMDEDALLNGVQEFKRQALNEVHNRYYPAIYRYIVFKVGDQETAEDLAGEVFVRFLDALRSGRAPQKTVKGWLYRVASNVVNDHYRQRYKGTPNISLTWETEGKRPGPHDQLVKKEIVDDLYEAVDELTQSQQDVVALRFGYGMRIREVADMIGKSEGAVKQLQARALASLSRLLGRQGRP